MKNRRLAKVLSLILTAVMIIGLLPWSNLSARAEGEASGKWTWTRFPGNDRYKTMEMVTKEAFEDGSCDYIIVASAQSFPDALAGAGLAGVYDAPVILTRKDKLSPEAASEIQRLAKEGCKVFILGGEGTVYPKVVEGIKKLGFSDEDIERVAGSNRDGTARAVYEKGKDADKGFADTDMVIIATGSSFADTLSISPYAYAARTPIFLTSGGKLSTDTKDLVLNTIQPEKILIVGGAVNEETENYLANNRKIVKLAGQNRYETSALIMKWELGLMDETEAAFQPEVTMTVEGMGIADGRNYPDALGSVSLLGRTASPLLLVADNSKKYREATQANINELVAPNTKNMTHGYIFGGTGSVSADIEQWLNNAVEAGPTIYETPEEILKALYELGDNEVLSDGYLYELEGTITAVVTAYNSGYNNITVNMEIEGLEEYPVQAFRLTAESTNEEMSAALQVLKTGDTIKVKGALKNYVKNGVSTKEFDAGCLLIGYTAGSTGPTIYETPEEILKALYELGDNEILSDGYLYELEGTITAVNTAYSSGYNNITVTMEVEGLEQYPVQAFRLTAESTNEEMSAALQVLKTGDTIKVKGVLKKYNGTPEFDAGCLLIGYTAGSTGPTIYETPEEILKALYELGDNQYLSDGYKYELEGVITEVNTAYAEEFNNITVTIVVGEWTEYPVQAYRLTAESTNEEMSAALKVLKTGDTIKVKGALKNYVKNGASTKEFDAGCLLIGYTAGGEEPPVVSDQEKVDYEAGKLTLPETVSVAGPLTLPTPEKYEDVQIAWVSDSELAVVDETAGTLTFTLPEEDTPIRVTATLTLNEASAERVFDILVKAPSEEQIYTVDEILAIMAGYENNQVSEEEYTVKGLATSSTYYVGSSYTSYNVWLQNEDGSVAKAFYLYSCQLAGDITDDYTAENAMALKTITCKGYLKRYGDTLEMAYISATDSSPLITKIEDVELSDQQKVDFEAARLTLPETVTTEEPFALPVPTTYTDVQIAWVCDSDLAFFDDDGTLKFTLPTEDITVHVTATLTLGDATKEVDFPILLKAPVVGGYTWTKVAWADITEDDVIAVTMVRAETTLKDVVYPETVYALSATKKGSSGQPLAVVVTRNGESITTDTTDDFAWKMAKEEAQFTLRIASGESYLYATSTNNGVRVGSSADNKFVIEGTYMKHVGTSRYLGAYWQNQNVPVEVTDWRCYTSTTGNIKDEVLTFWKLNEGGEEPPVVSDQEKVDYEAGKLALPEEISEAGQLTLPTPEKYEDVQIAWVSDSELAVVDETAGTLTFTLPEEDTTIHVTATLSLGDATAAKDFPILIKASDVVIYETPEEILKALYELGDNEFLSDGYLYELEGTITAVNTAYSSGFNNITVTMVVEGLEEYPVQAFRLTAESTNEEMSAALQVLKTGDTIKVKGALKNYVKNGVSTKEFDAGCLLIGYSAGSTGPTIYETPEEILKALYELGDNEYLSDGYKYELEGVITEVNTAYAEEFNNITVTIVVGEWTEYPVQAYRLTAESTNEEMSAALKVLKTGDTIKVKGALKNYVKNGASTKEFDTGSLLIGYTSGGEEPPVVSDQEKVDAAAAALELNEGPFAESTEVLLPVPADESITVTWESSNPEAFDVSDGIKMVVTQSAKEEEAVITATLTLGEATATATFHPVVKEAVPEGFYGFVTEIADGTTYKLGLKKYNEEDPKVYYFTGEVSGSFLKTSENVEDAVDLAVEESKDGYFISFTDADEATKYLDVDASGSKPGFALSNEKPEKGFGFDTVFNALTYNDEEKGLFVAGTFGTYTTISFSSAETYWDEFTVDDTQFPARFYEYLTLDEDPTAAEYLADEKQALELPQTIFTEATEIDLPEITGVTIAWTTNSEYATVSGNKLVITIPENEDANVNLDASLSYNGASAAKRFALTIKAPAADNVVTFVPGEIFTGNTDLTTDGMTIGDVSITFSKGSGSSVPMYYTNGADARVYKGNTFTVAAGNNLKIVKIEFTFSGSNVGVAHADSGEYAEGGTVWTGDAANVTFTNANAAGTNKQMRITKIVVTLGE